MVKLSSHWKIPWQSVNRSFRHARWVALSEATADGLCILAANKSETKTDCFACLRLVVTVPAHCNAITGTWLSHSWRNVHSYPKTAYIFRYVLCFSLQSWSRHVVLPYNWLRACFSTSKTSEHEVLLIQRLYLLSTFMFQLLGAAIQTKQRTLRFTLASATCFPPIRSWKRGFW
jgi:hypothetical protein